jgi:hypothetical protein
MILQSSDKLQISNSNFLGIDACNLKLTLEGSV